MLHAHRLKQCKLAGPAKALHVLVESAPELAYALGLPRPWDPPSLRQALVRTDAVSRNHPKAGLSLVVARLVEIHLRVRPHFVGQSSSFALSWTGHFVIVM